jgi:hypothetical protein
MAKKPLGKKRGPQERVSSPAHVRRAMAKARKATADLKKANAIADEKLKKLKEKFGRKKKSDKNAGNTA